ncbi:TetR/AcrR family transcriptional regulator [Nocardia sp. NPDC051832]|uniref:TetR/AcrR family transcriptional regulator n=1 Tax=Nocardia sp. NPDC051832 TaxID=3155673 RepID=UPI003441D124
MPPTRRRPTDDELLDAACVAFAELGYRGTSMDAVARQANSTKPTLYAHFGSKEELFRRLFHREADIMRAALLPVYATLPGRPVLEMVQVALGAAVRYGVEHPHGARVVGRAVNGGGPDPSLGRELLRTLIDAIAGVVEETLRREGRDPGPLGQLLASMIWGAAVEATRAAATLDISTPELVDWQITYTVAGLEATMARVLAGGRPPLDPGQSGTAAGG